MIESTRAGASDAGGGASSTRSAAVQGVRSFASELAKSADAGSSTTATTKAAARPDGEQTTKVAGHPFAKIVNGDDKGLYLNQLAGSPRLGTAFKLVERDDHVFHVYGTGKERVIIDVAHKAATGAPAPASS